MGNEFPEGYVGLCRSTACSHERHNQTEFCRGCLEMGLGHKDAAQDQMVASGNQDEIAKMIYDAMCWAALAPVPDGCVPEWVDGGNSDAQMRARDAGRRILSAITLTPYAEAKREGMLEAAKIADECKPDRPLQARAKAGQIACEIRAKAEEIKSGISVDILPMRLSGDRMEHWVRISCSGRTFDVRNYPDHLLNRALYERDSLRHVLLGHPKPNLMAEKYEDPKESK